MVFVHFRELSRDQMNAGSGWMRTEIERLSGMSGIDFKRKGKLIGFGDVLDASMQDFLSISHLA